MKTRFKKNIKFEATFPEGLDSYLLCPQLFLKYDDEPYFICENRVSRHMKQTHAESSSFRSSRLQTGIPTRIPLPSSAVLRMGGFARPGIAAIAR